MKTEAHIKLLLKWLHKAIIRWYEEHPKGMLQEDASIAYYSSACFGIDPQDNQGIARLTLETGDDRHPYIDITASTHGKELKNGLLGRR